MKRFATVSEDELSKKKKNLVPTTTQKATASSAATFREYLNEKGREVNFEHYDKNSLDATLSSFYLEARTKKGEMYKKTTLEGIRYGLNRHVKGPPYNRQFDLLSDPAFSKSNESFKIAMQEIKAAGKASITHHSPLTDYDREKLYTSIHLNPDTPVGLYNKVQYDIRYYFCRRGNENMHTMTKDTFAVKMDANTGRKYVFQNIDELTKNHRQDDAEGFSGFMPETGTIVCPVRSFERYISKLHPDCNRLWCYPKVSFHTDDECWYNNQPVGINTLQKFLPRLSLKCELSETYTNHSIRATGATVLHQNQHTPAEIMAITGHKSMSSLAVYQRTSSTQKMIMGTTLAGHVAGTSTAVGPFKPSGSNTLQGNVTAEAQSGRAHYPKGGDFTEEELINIFSDENDFNDPGADLANLLPSNIPFTNCQIKSLTINIINK